MNLPIITFAGGICCIIIGFTFCIAFSYGLYAGMGNWIIAIFSILWLILGLTNIVLGIIIILEFSRKRKLKKTENKSINFISQNINSETWEIRKQAVEDLGKIRFLIDKTIPLLAIALKDEDADIRDSAAESLGKIAYVSKVLPDVLEALKDKEWNVREEAARTLGKIKPKAYEAIPHLMKALIDKDSSVRKTAEKSLNQIDNNWRQSNITHSFIPFMTDALKDRDSGVRKAAAKFLKNIEAHTGN